MYLDFDFFSGGKHTVQPNRTLYKDTSYQRLTVRVVTTNKVRYIWNAVLTYIQIIQVAFNYLKIYSNELKISSNI